MRIDPSYRPQPQDSGRLNKVGSSPEKGESKPASDTFSGPKIGALKTKVASLDASREELVDRVSSELRDGTYITDEKIKKVVDRLIGKL